MRGSQALALCRGFGLGMTGAGTDLGALEGPGEQPWPGAGPKVLQDHVLLLMPRLNFTWSRCCGLSAARAQSTGIPVLAAPTVVLAHRGCKITPDIQE